MVQTFDVIYAGSAWFYGQYVVEWCVITGSFVGVVRWYSVIVTIAKNNGQLKHEQGIGKIRQKEGDCVGRQDFLDHKRGDRPNGGDCDEQQQPQEIFVHDRELSVAMFFHYSIQSLKSGHMALVASAESSFQQSNTSCTNSPAANPIDVVRQTSYHGSVRTILPI